MDTQTATMSTVSLPPAASRLGDLQFDAVGNPYYRFPPFLSPPEGVTLVPFKDFEPHGIQISLDPDQEELDGEGIPTVHLGTKHNNTENKDTKRRKRKSKKDSDQPRKSSPWWDDWAEGEDLRRATVFDPNIPRIERFSAGAAEFLQGRKFTPVLQSLYDHFRLFAGLLAAPKRDRYGKSNGDELDDEDDEAEFNAEAAATQVTDGNPSPAPDDQSYIEEVNEEQDLRMDAFLNDPEKSIKIFFSSFYKDKGLAWSEPKLRDGPILLSFFLAFFVRNRIMPDCERAFIKAHKIAEQARLELPQTTKISMSLPDVFGRACTSLWGSKVPDPWADTQYMDTDPPAPPPVVPDTAPEPVTEPTPAQEWEKQLRERGLEKIEVDIAEPSAATSTGWGDLDGPGWGNPSAEGPVNDAWGQDLSHQDAPVNDWNAGQRAPSLLEILGPTTIPLTHAVQRAEKATRQIVAFAPPRAEGAGLECVLGTVVLAPWKRYVKETPIARPQLLVDKVGNGEFDPGRDLIRAFVDPQVVEVLREGMGLHGLFVEVSQIDKADKPKEKPKSRGKARGKAKAADDREWWYVEFLYEVLPSFWAEEGAVE